MPEVAVSVVLPAFNRTQYLRHAIESVFAQTLADWELIIVDDGSAEHTRSYLRGLIDARVRVIWLTHTGNPSRVRNAGIDIARGDYVAFLDSDDVWAPPKLETQIRVLRALPRRRWSHTATDRIDENGRPLSGQDAGRDVGRDTRKEAPADGWILERLVTLDASVAMPTIMADRRLIQEIGGFDEGQLYGEFHDLCVRLAMRSEVSYLAQPLCSIRAHGEHYSADRIAAYQSWDRLYGKMAALAPSARSRARCQRLRAEASLTLAGLQDIKGDRRAAWTTLARASSFSWRYPDWWFGAVKRLARPLVPKAVIAMVRHRRE